MKSVCLLFTLLLSALTATHAADAPSAPGMMGYDRNTLYLYDRTHHHNHGIKADPAHLLPHRVYMKYDTTLHSWIYIMTELDGTFASPTEALRPQTVAPGSVIGASLSLQRFILTYDGSWMPTSKPERFRFIRLTTPPQIFDAVFERKPAKLPK